jgi:hypothetical protein
LLPLHSKCEPVTFRRARYGLDVIDRPNCAAAPVLCVFDDEQSRGGEVMVIHPDRVFDLGGSELPARSIKQGNRASRDGSPSAGLIAVDMAITMAQDFVAG